MSLFQCNKRLYLVRQTIKKQSVKTLLFMFFEKVCEKVIQYKDKYVIIKMEM